MMKEKQAEILLAAVITARATAFIFAKWCLADLDTFNLLAVRFLLAFLLLGVLFFRKLRGISLRTVGRGALMGVLFYLVMGCEVSALHTADTSVVSALENTAIILVPLFEAALHRRRPDRTALLCAASALAGVLLINFSGGTLHFGKGECLAMLSAVIYAAAIITTDRCSHRETNTVALGVIQIGMLGMLALVTSLLTEQTHLPGSGSVWGMIALLAVVCTGFGFTLQPVAQRYTSAETAGLFCALNPLVAAILGAAVLHEQLGVTGFAGIALILLSILVPHLPALANAVKKGYTESSNPERKSVL